MKTVLSLFIFLLLTSTIFSQDDKQPRFVIKTHPGMLLFDNCKIGVDYAINTRYTLETQVGMLIWDGTERPTENHKHVQVRLKRDVVKGRKNLQGLYLAPGVEFGEYVSSYVKNQTYLSGFVDFGYQFAIWNFNLEMFIGTGGVTETEGRLRQIPNCDYCPVDYQQNALFIDGFIARFGWRLGYAF